MFRHTVLAVATTAATLACLTTARAAQTQTLIAGAELLAQNASGQWNLNLISGARFGTDDGSPVSAVRTMKLSFPSGARMNADAFKTCSFAQVSDGACPAASKLGTGTATTLLGTSTVPATITIFNGPGNASKRRIWMYSRALSTIEFVLDGTIRKTSGTYGYVLNVNVPPIVPELVPGGVAILDFETTIGGSGRKNGKIVPLVTSPTSCRKGGWRYSGTFTFANGSSATSGAAISCRLTATPTD